MKGSLVLIYVRPSPGKTREDLEAVLEKAIDWYRYAEGSYVLQTTSDQGVWYRRLMPIFEPKGHLLITRFTMDAYLGYMPEPFWHWLNKVTGVDSMSAAAAKGFRKPETQA